MRRTNKILRVSELVAGAFLLVGSAFPAFALNLPPGATFPTVTFDASFGLDAYLESQFTGLPGGYDVANAPASYDTWCVDPAGDLGSVNLTGTTTLNPGPYTFHDTSDSVALTLLPAATWHEINWVLNNKGSATVIDVQEAIWYLESSPHAFHYNYFITSSSQFPKALTLATTAMGNSTFTPPPGGVQAVLLFDGPLENAQDLIIELPVPPTIQLTKTANPTIFSKVGDVITYTYTITNTGTTTLNGPFNINDDKLGNFKCNPAPPPPGGPKPPPPPPGSPPPPPKGSIAPGGTLTCTATYTIKQADLAGCITNIATATGNGLTSNQDTAKVCPLPFCNVGYPFGSAPALTSVVFNESTVLASFAYMPTGGTDHLGSVSLWATDEHAPTLGVREVDVKTSSGTTKDMFFVTPYPDGSSGASAIPPSVGTTALTGNDAGTDVALTLSGYAGHYPAGFGRPIWPSLFLTDLTLNPGPPFVGDWQMAGTASNPIPPNALYGSWKSALKTVDTTKTPNAITVTPDGDPAKNGWNGVPDTPPGGFPSSLGYGAEMVWNTSGLGLISGHSYHVQLMVHDGDQNKAGGDVGEACLLVTP